jgi:MFS family permease
MIEAAKETTATTSGTHNELPTTHYERLLDRRHRSLTVGSVLATSIVAFEGLALTTVAPVITRDLGDTSLYGWVFSAFLLSQIVGTVCAGQQADWRGIEAPFLAALALLGVGLVVCGVSAGVPAFLLGRALQGLGAGALTTCVYATVNTAYPDHLRPRMLAALSSAYVLPALMGPAMAGFIAETFTWRAVFLGFIPLLLAVGLLGAPGFGQLGPKSTASREAEANRLPAAVGLAAGTGLLLAGLHAAPTILAVVLLTAGLAATVPSLRTLLPEGTFAGRRGLPATVAARGLFGAAYLCAEVYLVLALTTLGGYSATAAGIVVSARAICWAAGTWVQERWDERHQGRGRRARVVIGVSLMASGIAVISFPVFGGAAPGIGGALLGSAMTALGIGLAHPSTSAVAFALAPRGREGGVSSSLQLADCFAPGLAAGVGGALVELGRSSSGGLGLAFGFSLALAALALLSALRLPATGSEPAGVASSSLPASPTAARRPEL